MATTMWRRQSLIFSIVAIAVAAACLSGVYLYTAGYLGSKHAGPSVLVASGTTYSLPGEQFNAIAMNLQKTSVVSGIFTNTKGITLYTMTPAEVLSLSKTGVIGSYAWTSGRIANLTVTHFNLTFSPGSWELVFWNADGPSPVLFPSANTTVIAFYTNLVLS